MRRAAATRGTALGALFLAVAVVMVFPEVSRLRSHTAGNYGDPFLTQWALRWDVHALVHDPSQLFHANIYWPSRNTLTYSDTLLAVAPLAGGLAAVFGWPFTFNLLYLGSWVASLVATFLLARWFGARPGAAVLAAFVFTFAAPRLAHYGHFQLGFAFLVPLGVLVVLRFLEERSWWQAVALGVVAASTFLMAVYHALALAVTLAVVVGGWLLAERLRPGRRLVAGLVVAGVVAGVLAGPSAYMYLQHGSELSPVVDPARPGDVLAPAEGSYLYGSLDELAARQGRDYQHRLFPGLAATVLGVAGAVDLWRRRRHEGPHHVRRALVLVLVASGAVGVLALGPWQSIAGQRVPLPYRLVEVLPGFDAVRALTRFAVIPLLGLALLTARGFDRALAGRSARAVSAAAVIVGAAMLGEYKVPIETSARIDRPELAAVNVALRGLPPGPVLELPMGDANTPMWGYVESPRMLLSTIDWHPRINGYSGYSPPHYLETVGTMRGLGDSSALIPDVLRRLDELNVRYVVLRTAPMSAELDLPGVTHYDRATAQRVIEALPRQRVERVSREGEATLITLRAPR